MTDLIVVAVHGEDWWPQCVASLGEGAPYQLWDTGSYPTGKYLGLYEYVVAGEFPPGYEHIRDADRFLFLQDSMTALTPDYLRWFRDQMLSDLCAVAWGRFPMQWDTHEQKARVEARYGGPGPEHGIFGPVFYTTRAALDVLAEKDLLPRVPTTRLEAQGTERAWAYAFARAGIPVVGPLWDPDAMKTGFGPFKKVWAARP